MKGYETRMRTKLKPAKKMFLFSSGDSPHRRSVISARVFLMEGITVWLASFLGQNGGRSQTLDEHPQTILYISVFTGHFLNLPAKNEDFLRKCYFDFGLSALKISELSGDNWPRTTIIDSLRHHGIEKGCGRRKI